ncbi:MAG: Stp1/IreP family PP2C-type Ser/Thr phosphatase [Clostridia bacterium]|nr:Stp1/IreP family PP2C-type Ser/Thr phosphatase [Clostridia bacterium]
MRAKGMSIVGQRDNNEDSFIVDQQENIFAVADGMGGHNAGEVASRLAVNTVGEYLRGKACAANPFKKMEQAIRDANLKVYNQAQSNVNQRGMGTTLTILWVIDNTAYIANVGDSRAYLLRKNKLVLLTSDHSLVQELLNNGNITENEASRHPKRNILTRAVGTQDHIEADFIDLRLKKGDFLLLCTDGLSNTVPMGEMEKILSDSGSVEKGCLNLIKTAESMGSEDNVTAVLVYND